MLLIMLFEFRKKDTSRRIIFVLQTHPSKSVHKICWKYGMLLNTNSTTYALIRICRKFSKQMFLRGTGHILLIVFLLAILCLDILLTQTSNGDIWFQWFLLYMLSGRYFCLNFTNCVVSTCGGTFVTQPSQTSKLKL